MKVIIAGSRSADDYYELLTAITLAEFTIDEVVSGGARGADKLGERFALSSDIPIRKFIPDWNRYGKSAGFRRNIEMADYADALIALWDGNSRGTNHMIQIAQKKGLQVFVWRIPRSSFTKSLRTEQTQEPQ